MGESESSSSSLAAISAADREVEPKVEASVDKTPLEATEEPVELTELALVLLPNSRCDPMEVVLVFLCELRMGPPYRELLLPLAGGAIEG